MPEKNDYDLEVTGAQIQVGDTILYCKFGSGPSWLRPSDPARGRIVRITDKIAYTESHNFGGWLLGDAWHFRVKRDAVVQASSPQVIGPECVTLEIGPKDLRVGDRITHWQLSPTASWNTVHTDWSSDNLNKYSMPIIRITADGAYTNDSTQPTWTMKMEGSRYRIIRPTTQPHAITKTVEVLELSPSDIRVGDTITHVLYTHTEGQQDGWFSEYAEYRLPISRINYLGFHVVMSNGRESNPWSLNAYKYRVERPVDTTMRFVTYKRAPEDVSSHHAIVDVAVAMTKMVGTDARAPDNKLTGHESDSWSAALRMKQAEAKTKAKYQVLCDIQDVD